MRLERAIDLTQKAWAYSLMLAAHPLTAPGLVGRMLFQYVHPGEILSLWAYRRWIVDAGIQTVIDIGANTGQFASAIGSILPEVQIYCFEPLPDCAAVLKRRLSRRGRCEVFPFALGDRDSDDECFWRSSFSESSSFLEMSEEHKRLFPWTATQVPVSVPLRRLDRVAGELTLARKTLLKIDVQGFEGRVLAGAMSTLARIHYVLLEVSTRPLYQSEASFMELHELLSRSGFEYGGNLRQLTSPDDGSVVQADALFIRAGE